MSRSSWTRVLVLIGALAIAGSVALAATLEHRAADSSSKEEHASGLMLKENGRNRVEVTTPATLEEPLKT
jgi:hypothetical protein